MNQLPVSSLQLLLGHRRYEKPHSTSLGEIGNCPKIQELSKFYHLAKIEDPYKLIRKYYSSHIAVDIDVSITNGNLQEDNRQILILNVTNIQLASSDQSKSDQPASSHHAFIAGKIQKQLDLKSESKQFYGVLSIKDFILPLVDSAFHADYLKGIHSNCVRAFLDPFAINGRGETMNGNLNVQEEAYDKEREKVSYKLSMNLL